MYILFFFVTTFSNNLYKLFLFYIIDTLLNIAKLDNVSKPLHGLVIARSTNSTLNESHNLLQVLWMFIPQWSFLLTTLGAAFLLFARLNQSDSFSASPDDGFFCVLLNQLLIDECPSDILDMFWFLWQRVSI